MASVKDARKALRVHALKHPGAWEDHPWDEDVAKVGEKVFVFFGREGSDLFVGVKLDRSLLFARAQAFVTKFGYGLDASGWIAARFSAGVPVPIDLLRSWIDESYATVAAAAASMRATRKRARPRSARRAR